MEDDGTTTSIVSDAIVPNSTTKTQDVTVTAVKPAPSLDLLDMDLAPVASADLPDDLDMADPWAHIAGQLPVDGGNDDDDDKAKKKDTTTTTTTAAVPTKTDNPNNDDEQMRNNEQPLTPERSPPRRGEEEVHVVRLQEEAPSTPHKAAGGALAADRSGAISPTSPKQQSKALSPKSPRSPAATPPRHPNAKRNLMDLGVEEDDDEESEAVDEDEEEHDDDYDDDDDDASVSSSEVTSNVGTDVSEFGPMMKLASKLAQEEEELWTREEEEDQRRIQKIRSKAPKKMPSPDLSLKKFKEKQREREMLNQKREKTNKSLLTRAKTRNSEAEDNSSPVVTGVAKSLFYASTKGAEHVVEDVKVKQQTGSPSRNINKTPQHHKSVPASDGYIRAIFPEDEANLVMTPRLSKERTKVVQLFVMGGIGTVFGFFGSIFSQAACNYADVTSNDAYNAVTFHFGLWKYTPMESVYKGYSFCTDYSDEFSDEGPVESRTLALTALGFSTLSLAILWIYLATHYIVPTLWRIGVVLMFLASLLQAVSIFMFFDSHLCTSGDFSCSFAPAGIMSIVVTVLYFLLALSLTFATPMSVRSSNTPAAALASKTSPRKVGWLAKLFGETDAAAAPSLRNAAATRKDDHYIPPIV